MYYRRGDVGGGKIGIVVRCDFANLIGYFNGIRSRLACDIVTQITHSEIIRPKGSIGE